MSSTQDMGLTTEGTDCKSTPAGRERHIYASLNLRQWGVIRARHATPLRFLSGYRKGSPLLGC